MRIYGIFDYETIIRELTVRLPFTIAAPFLPLRESGTRAGYNGHKKRKTQKFIWPSIHWGIYLAMKVTPTNENDRSQVAALSEELQEATGQSVEIAYVDQGYTGDNAVEQAQKHGIELIVVRLQEAKKGFVLLPRR